VSGLFDDYERHCDYLASAYFATDREMKELKSVASLIRSKGSALEKSLLWFNFNASKNISLSAAQAVALWKKVPHTLAICHMIFSAVVDWWTLPHIAVYESFPSLVICYYAFGGDKTVYKGLEKQLMEAKTEEDFPKPSMWTRGPRYNFSDTDLSKLVSS